MEYTLFGIQLLKIACITVIAFILIATLVFIICVCVARGQASEREEKAIDEYLHREKIRRLKQANRELKEGCIKQSRGEEMESQYKEYYSKPLKVKKNKLRRKAINSIKELKKINWLDSDIKSIRLNRREYGLNHPHLKTISRYFKSEDK